MAWNHTAAPGSGRNVFGTASLAVGRGRRGADAPGDAVVLERPAGRRSGVGGHGSRQGADRESAIIRLRGGQGLRRSTRRRRGQGRRGRGFQADGPRRPGGCVRRSGSVRRRELGRRWSERATACVSSIRRRRGPATPRSVPPPGRNPKHVVTKGSTPAGRRLTGRAAGRPGDDQASARGRGAAALDVLPHACQGGYLW